MSENHFYSFQIRQLPKYFAHMLVRFRLSSLILKVIDYLKTSFLGISF